MNGPTPIMFDMFSAVAWQQAEAALEGGWGHGGQCVREMQQCTMHNAQWKARRAPGLRAIRSSIAQRPQTCLAP